MNLAPSLNTDMFALTNHCKNYMYLITNNNNQKLCFGHIYRRNP